MINSDDRAQYRKGNYRWNPIQIKRIDPRPPLSADPQRDVLLRLMELLKEVESEQRCAPFLPEVRVKILQGVRSWVESFLRASGGNTDGGGTPLPDELGAHDDGNIDRQRKNLSEWVSRRKRLHKIDRVLGRRT